MQILATREDYRLAWLAALAITIHIAESALPSPLPGVKPGLANVITVITLIRYGWGSAAWVSMLRVLAGSLLIGSFLSPTFLLSATGAVCALIALGLGKQLSGGRLGPVGYSLLAAEAHMAGQFLTAYSLFIPHPELLRIFPLLMGLALLFGLVTGTIAHAVLTRLPAELDDRSLSRP
ncbi:MAG: Gx transporter family protein [Gammaproteobacteria bacterium]|jgi:heptaprenyl diphosphate synthase